MYRTTWFMSVVSLLVVDVRTGALQQQVVQPRRCYQCASTNSSACDQAGSWSTIVCPNVQQLCATVAVGPDFTSSLACAVPTEKACSLKYTSKHALKLTCVCTGQLCNAPFSQTLRNKLLNYTQLNSTDLNIELFEFSKLANVSEARLHSEVAEVTEISMKNSSELTTLRSVSTAISTNAHLLSKHLDQPLPQAEALKQEATIPSEDDEDESEGSGSEEEARSRVPPASAPAAPSSFLPANENKGCSMQSIFKYWPLTPLFVYIAV